MGAGKGHVILVVGKQDTGKTTFSKKLIASNGKPSFIYDYRAEYGGKRQTFKEFILQAVLKRGYNIVIEEATVFLSNRGDDENIKNLLAGRSHDNNTIVIIYHSLRSVPVYIMDLTDYYVLFKTNDNEQMIEQKFKFHPTLLEDFETCKESEDSHFHIVRKVDL